MNDYEFLKINKYKFKYKDIYWLITFFLKGKWKRLYYTIKYFFKK